MNQYNSHLGLDISKDKIDCALIKDEAPTAHKIIDNNEAGFTELQSWLAEQQVEPDKLHVCCEATNVYYIPIATHLNQSQVAISVINPSIIKSYASLKLKRIKTDKQDAKLIAQYCRAENPNLWQPEHKNKAQLKSLCRRAEQINQLLTMEKNRAHVADEFSQASIARTIEWLEAELETCRESIQNLIKQDETLKQQQKILMSIVGIGQTTAQVLLSVLVDIDKFPTAKKLVSWLGLSPVIRQSGKHKGLSKLSKMGDKSIRKALYTPARVACTRSKLWRAWFDEKAKTKPVKQVYVLMMVKLVKYAYYCIKRNELFDEKRHVRAERSWKTVKGEAL
jgi:pilin protein inverting protein|nr:IS110 family transposase [uncultured Kingella sp.]